MSKKPTLEELVAKCEEGNQHPNMWDDAAHFITPKLGFKRLNKNAILPTKAHASDSGYDLYAAEDIVVEPGQTKIIPTGIALELPKGYEGQVRPRSGITVRTKLRVQLGTIDQDFKGEVGIIVDNIDSKSARFVSHVRGIDGNKYYANEGHPGDGDRGVSSSSYIIRKGDRLAQLVLAPLVQTDTYEVEGDLSESERGDSGFGSSGVRDDE